MLTEFGSIFGYRFAPSMRFRKKIYGELTLYRKKTVKLLSSKIIWLGTNRGERFIMRSNLERSSLVTRICYNRQIIVLANTHLISVALNKPRYRQASILLSALERSRIPTVILGDFNLSSIIGKKKLLLIMKQFGYTTLGKRLVTHRLVGIRHQMDYIFWKNCSIGTVFIERVKFSDHYPLLFNVRINV
jgi:endonuclease/exonuclease/phosphatase family metal-dependent hydrolase